MSETKPPLGVVPKHLWDEKRHDEIFKAIGRYLEAGRQIPVEWITEYNEYLKNKYKDIDNV